MFNKNIKKAICIALLLVTVMLIFCGCGGSDDNEDDNYVYGTYEGLDEETEKQIRQDFLVQYAQPENPSIKLKDVGIVHYYGIYDGCIVVMMAYKMMPVDDVISGGTIAGIEFRLNDSRDIKAWKEGIFCNLKEAYDNGLLTRDALIQISEIQKNKFPFLYNDR